MVIDKLHSIIIGWKVIDMTFWLVEIIRPKKALVMKPKQHANSKLSSESLYENIYQRTYKKLLTKLHDSQVTCFKYETEWSRKPTQKKYNKHKNTAASSFWFHWQYRYGSYCWVILLYVYMIREISRGTRR